MQWSYTSWLACVHSWNEQGWHYIDLCCFETNIVTVNRLLIHLYFYLKQVLYLYCDMFDILSFEYAGSLEGKKLYSYHVYCNNCTIIIDTIVYKHVVNLLHVLAIYREVFYSMLTFQSLAVTLRTTMFKIQKFCTLIRLHLCVLYQSQNKQQLYPYTALTDWFL